MTKATKAVSPQAGTPAKQDLDLAIVAIDARDSGFARDGMCFNKV